MHDRRWGAALLALLLTVTATILGTAGPVGAATSTGGSFYTYSGGTPLSSIAPGTVLKTRTISYHVAKIPVPLKVVQLLYRSTGVLGQPTTAVTSVVQPPVRSSTPRLLSYQSFYDSLNPADEPSAQIAGGLSLGGMIYTVEPALFTSFLLQGYSIAIPDTEGQAADFAAGPEYGMNTLDGLRAALASAATGLPASTKIGMIGYSGGAIATEWASEMAPKYAPDVNKHLVGAAMGGVLVDPAHNLHYIDGSTVWAGVMPMAIIGISRSFHIDLTPYLSAYGLKVYNQLLHASIANALGEYPGLTWAKLAKPQYPTPESVPVYAPLVNQLIMGATGTPTTPLFVGQGANGVLEGTRGNKPGIGAGDGVMIAGDVRSLAREYCARGVTVDYQQYNATSHVLSVPLWLPAAISWLTARFAGKAAPQNCSQIAPGNRLTPLPVTAG